MTIYRRIKSAKPQAGGSANRITVVANGVTYAINQTQLNKFTTAEELKAALEKFLGHAVPDIWFHLNRNGRWAIATGPTPPEVWPEDEVIT